ncbi:MAG: DUF4058 family protein [Gemmataceae bacterium]|nr:DUF4058 family protein [Gemmataceae bacterium]
MPFRDHFHSPLDDQTSWDLFHGQWPAMIVQRLNSILPLRYVAAPHVHLGTEVEIDVATLEKDGSAIPDFTVGNGTTWPLSEPSVAVETDLLNTDEYEVRVYDTERGRRLVAAVEIVSPANKDRPESRLVFVAKCEALLRKGVSVSIVDLVTSRHFNLYVELLDLIGRNDPTLGAEPPATYAAACRWIERGRKRILETWSHTLTLGQPLPTLPLWVAENFAVPLELEASYEETCRVLRIA